MPAFDMFEQSPNRNRMEFRQKLKIIPENPGTAKKEINLTTADIFKE